MFGFNKDEEGSRQRFTDRAHSYKMMYKTLPRVRHYLWWLIHNCISHPAIGIFPVTLAFRFHDWTSKKMHPDVTARTREIVDMLDSRLVEFVRTIPDETTVVLDRVLDVLKRNVTNHPSRPKYIDDGIILINDEIARRGLKVK